MAGTSTWQLQFDRASTDALLWKATASATGEVKPEIQRYLGDWYRRLADHHFRSGRLGRAERLNAKARWRLRLGGRDEGFPALVLAMPVQPSPAFTGAIGIRSEGPGPDNAAWSST
jgi:hypothetical protein